MDIETNFTFTSRGSEAGVCRRYFGRLYQFWLNYRRPILIIMCISLQSLVSSILWNYFMISYHTVLETDQYAGDINYRQIVKTQSEILKSSPMWMVSYFWRLVNPQNMTQLQLLAILYGKELIFFFPFSFLDFSTIIVDGIVYASSDCCSCSQRSIL
eukprot:TRINITY_DN30883_c0_g1_i1.p1 TRINITY_DN30883_c0_g1~~TRINITY_DN30883_c0_g1_i1.p1  ORF type:complete len:165 (-),score=29.18 TRINITY_DN30883_c0_g1_i1:44-514(-)